DVAIASFGPVASVALYTKRPVSDIRSIALDTSSRTSVAPTRVPCANAFRINPSLEASGPDLGLMLARCDAALLIGDSALLSEGRKDVEKIDLGAECTNVSCLPFVYACWAGRRAVVTSDDVRALQEARDAGVERPERVAADYFADPAL